MKIAPSIRADQKHEGIEYVADCPDGRLKTHFLIPTVIEKGFAIPNLSLCCFGSTFTFSGRYDHVCQNMEFRLIGPSGHGYKIVLLVAKPEETSGSNHRESLYKWKLTKRGITIGTSAEDLETDQSGTIYMPKEMCCSFASANATLMGGNAGQSIKWVFGPQEYRGQELQNEDHDEFRGKSHLVQVEIRIIGRSSDKRDIQRGLLEQEDFADLDANS